MDVDNNAFIYDLLLFLLFAMVILSWFRILFCFYTISTLLLQYPVTVDEVEETAEDDIAKDILRQLRINMETKDQLNVSEYHTT